MNSYLWPLGDVLIAVLVFFIFREVAKRIRLWAEDQREAIDAGQHCTEKTGRVIVKLQDLASQQSSKALTVALALWFLCSLGVLVFSGALIPLEPDQIPPDTLEWMITRWTGFVLLSVGPWLFGFYMLFSGSAIRVLMEKGILNLKPFGQGDFITWDEVKKLYVWKNKLGVPYFYVDTRHGTMILGMDDKNIRKFAELISKNLPQDKWIKSVDYLQLAAMAHTDATEEDEEGEEDEESEDSGSARLEFTPESLELARLGLQDFLVSKGGYFSKSDLKEIKFDFSPESLRRLEPHLTHSAQEYRDQIPRATRGPDSTWSPIDAWNPPVGLGSYFGEVMVRNLGGRWEGPSHSLVEQCQRSGDVDPIFQQWFVVVRGQEVPVFELAGRRWEMGPSESLELAYRKIAEGRYEPLQQHYKPQRVFK